MIQLQDSGNSSSAQGSTPSSRHRPRLRPYTAPCVVAAREGANPKKRPLDAAEYGELLIDEFATGSSSAIKVQKHASSAMRWLTSNGGVTTTEDTVRNLSKLGTEGKRPANAERDTHRMMRKTGQWLGAAIHHKRVRLVNPSTFEESYQLLPMILPHQFCLALWRCGEEVFKRCLFGRFTEKEVEAFWDHIEMKCEWFDGHPAASWTTRSRLASIGTYGDEVQAYKNSDCGSVAVVAWTAELAYLNPAMLRYFPVAIWSEHHESEHTYNDCMKHVVESFQMLADPSQKWPWSDKGYLLCYTFAQGDLKWINDRMNLFNFRANNFCSRCECVKNDDGGNVYNTLTHFSDDPDTFAPCDYMGLTWYKNIRCYLHYLWPWRECCTMSAILNFWGLARPAMVRH
eukprot:symbB.v1.2.024783.t1/scaffold2245.1/size172089/9